MAEIFTPQLTSNLTNQTSITQAIDNNFNKISSLLNDVLATGGTAPNAMQSSLDMNSNRIYNLGSPQSLSDVARMQDITSAGGTVNITNSTVGGLINGGSSGNLAYYSASGSTLSALSSGATVSGDVVWGGNQIFGSGRPWADVTAFGADPTGVADSASAIQAAVDYMTTHHSGGIVFFPTGNYLAHSAITIAATGQVGITLQGTGLGLVGGGSQLTSGTSDNALVVFTGSPTPASGGGIYSMAIVGLVSSTATTNVVTVGKEAYITMRDVLVWGGNAALDTSGIDCCFDNCYLSGGKQACVLSQGANWFIRCKLDSNTCQYAFFQGDAFGAASGGVMENHLIQCDLSGNFVASALIDDTYKQAITVFEGCVFSNTTQIVSAAFTIISAGEIGDKIITGVNSGKSVVSGCLATGSAITGVSSASTIVSGCYNIS